MKNCKSYKIFKFKPLGKTRKEIVKKNNYIAYYKVNLIDKFSKENFEELGKYFFSKSKKDKLVYHKPWLMGTFEIGLDMINEEYGVLFEYHWDYLYIAVPLKYEQIVNWFDENKPDWVTTVKRI